MASCVLLGCGSTAASGTGGGSGGSATGGSTGGGSGGAATGGSAGTGGDTGGGTGGSSTGGSTGGGSGGSATGGSTGGGSGGSATGGSTGGGTGGSATGGGTGGAAWTGIPTVFVIAMENKNSSGIYGNTSAPYINNTLMAQYGHSTDYEDCTNVIIPSEPHYIWLEAGTNSFSLTDTFLLDSDPSASNSTADTTHIVTQLKTAANGKTWRSYQEGLDASTTGACPIHSSGYYKAKHDPFIFFQDVAGSPPSTTATECVSHHKAYTPAGFQADLTAGDVAAYTFITPNICNDMHGDASCTNGCTSGTAAACVSTGDAWLAANVPPIIDYMNVHGGVLFIVWDEPEASTTQPFLVIGPHVKAGHASSVKYTHSSYVKSLERILKLPVMSRVTAANDFADFFDTGFFP